MSGWDTWAANVVAAGAANGAAIYDPCSGSIWGKSGEFECCGGLNQYDNKACGKEAAVPAINGKTYMFIRNTLDEEPCSVFKKGEDSMFLTKGPSGSKVAVFVKGAKPEPIIAKVDTYLKPNV